MTHGLPEGVRGEELNSFTLEHPKGVRVQFNRYEENSWVVESIEEDNRLGNLTVERSLNALIHDVERSGDAVVLRSPVKELSRHL